MERPILIKVIVALLALGLITILITIMFRIVKDNKKK